MAKYFIKLGVIQPVALEHVFLSVSRSNFSLKMSSLTSRPNMTLTRRMFKCSITDDTREKDEDHESHGDVIPVDLHKCHIIFQDADSRKQARLRLNFTVCGHYYATLQQAKNIPSPALLQV